MKTTNNVEEKIVNEIKTNFYNLIKSGEIKINEKNLPTKLIFKSIYNPNFDLFTDNIDLIIDQMFENVYYLLQIDSSNNFILSCNNRIKFYFECDKEIVHKHFFKKNTKEIIKVQTPYYLGSFELNYNNNDNITTMIFSPFKTCKLTIVSNDKFKTIEDLIKTEYRPLN